MKCFHCGDICNSNDFQYEDHSFCCNGCKVVYQLLNENGLGNYYSLQEAPGSKVDGHKNSHKYEYLDNEEFKEAFILYKDETLMRVSLRLPQIHCSSCIWLLENLSKLHKGVKQCTVNFSEKKAEITFLHHYITLRQLAELLDSIGYTADLYSSQNTEHTKTSLNRKIYYQIGIAGFCFGNIMLFSFPEYLGIGHSFKQFSSFFAWLSLLLIIPSFFYSGKDYLTNAFKVIKQKHINMDVPIALGMITLLVRSAYEITTQNGSGYLDSLSGLIFFLLIGKWLQQKSYSAMSFDRDYKSYFPIAASKVIKGKLVSTNIHQLKPNDEVFLRNNELIPADGMLLSDEAEIDYSFVTGEANIIQKFKGDLLYAGGKQVGSAIKVRLTKRVKNSYLTQLWNQKAFQKAEEEHRDLSYLSDQVSKYFTIIVLAITLFTALYWAWIDGSKIWTSVTAVLIVACPCALALSIPFTYGNMMSKMGSFGFYLKNANIIEKMSKITTIIFDKTGTITYKGAKKITYHGETLTSNDKSIIKTMVNNSIHPLSHAIRKYMNGAKITTPIDAFKEVAGEGISGQVNGNMVKIGSSSFTNSIDPVSDSSTKTFVSFNRKTIGYFRFEQAFRKDLDVLITTLRKDYPVHLLTGDSNCDVSFFKKEFGFEHIAYGQSPINKMEYIQSLQKKEDRVLMIGDGLNDAGALKQSDVGIAVSDELMQFSPACDAILHAPQLKKLPDLIELSKVGVNIVKWSFAISFLYNIIGLSFAVTGNLSPVIAAILMPLSSVTVVIFATFSSRFFANTYLSKKADSNQYSP